MLPTNVSAAVIRRVKQHLALFFIRSSGARSIIQIKNTSHNAVAADVVFTPSGHCQRGLNATLLKGLTCDSLIGSTLFA